MDSELSHVNPLTVGRVQMVKGPYALAWPPGALSAIDVVTWVPEFSTLGRGSVSCALALDHGDNGNTSNGIARLRGPPRSSAMPSPSVDAPETTTTTAAAK